ncbi:MAG: hypothetical protein J4431_03500 [Candidatus Aenigmarchaeota archaeon]|nr:hypothetical protein [Candidatus Aenigmarchaeota archaeon]
MNIPEGLSPKFLAISTVYFMVLIVNVFYFILPALSVLTPYAEFYVYLLLVFAPMAPLAMLLAGTGMARHHETAFKLIFAAMTIISLFATIFFTLPALI